MCGWLAWGACLVDFLLIPELRDQIPGKVLYHDIAKLVWNSWDTAGD